jgi:hypothetical protein
VAGRQDNGDRLSLQTLIIAAIASATAAVVVSEFWSKGTVISAAITPVVVAIVSELLRRPAQGVTRLTSATARSRTAGSGELASSAATSRTPGSREPSTAGLERLGGEVAAASRGAPPPPEGPRPGAMRVYSQRPPRRQVHLKVALITGLLAFAVAAAALTLPELIGGSAIGGGNRDTTLFGGGSKSKDKQTEQQQQTGTEQQQTDTEQQPGETTPEQTAPEQTAPQQTAPQQTAPQQTTPAPAPAPQQPQPSPSG